MLGLQWARDQTKDLQEGLQPELTKSEVGLIICRLFSTYLDVPSGAAEFTALADF